MAEKINAYFLRCDHGKQYKGYVAQIEDSLEAYQAYVYGTIQTVHITPEIIVICNDEGKLLEFPLNRAWMDMDRSQVIDFFAGDILLLRSNGEEFASIEPEDIPIIEQCLIPLKSVSKVGDHIAFVMYPAEFCSEWHE